MTTQTAKEETRCRHMGYAFRLSARVLSYAASSNRQDNTYHGLCYTSRGALAGTRILKEDPPPQCGHCQCILTVHHILLECNHLDQTRKDIFGRRDVVKSYRFHSTLILSFLNNAIFILNVKEDRNEQG